MCFRPSRPRRIILCFRHGISTYATYRLGNQRGADPAFTDYRRKCRSFCQGLSAERSQLIRQKDGRKALRFSPIFFFGDKMSGLENWHATSTKSHCLCRYFWGSEDRCRKNNGLFARFKEKHRQWKRDFFLPSPSAEKIVLRKIKMLFTFETDFRDRKSYFINLTK